MTYSSQLIYYLKNQFPQNVSLSELMIHLDLTHTEVSELISELTAEGYPISSDNGHCQFDVPLINPALIEKELTPRTVGHHVVFKDHTHSTNALALDNLDSFSHGDIILTDFQTNGRGRMGRSWEASLGKSIALSVVLKPDIDNSQAVLLTQLTAAALAKAIDPITDCSIKWPNDLIVNNKKVAGVLTESQFQGAYLDGIVIGVGINTNLDFDDSDEEIQSKATSLLNETEKVTDPNQLICSFIHWFDELYTEWEQTGDSTAFIRVCKEKSIVLNKEITVRDGGSSRVAQVIDINPLGELIIRYKDEKTHEILHSLDFSIRGKHSYI